MWSDWPKRLVIAVGLVGFVATSAVAVHVSRKPGVYFAEVQALFLAPRSADDPNSLVTENQGLASLAGAVARIVDPDAPRAQVVSPDVTLVDEGVRDGSSVTLPNNGGQFVY